MMRPDANVLTVAASSSGRSRKPDCVALAPVTTCRNTGMNTTTAKNASVVRNSVAETTVKTGMRNSRSGRIGSLARRSRAIHPASSVAPAAASPTISADPHAYSRPPHVVTSSTHVSAPASSPAPA